MKELVARRIANLLAIKSLVTLTFTFVYSYLLVRGLGVPEGFQNIYLMIIGFYFGSQAEKIHAQKDPTVEDYK